MDYAQKYIDNLLFISTLSAIILPTIWLAAFGIKRLLKKESENNSDKIDFSVKLFTKIATSSSLPSAPAMLIYALYPEMATNVAQLAIQFIFAAVVIVILFVADFFKL